MSRQYLAIQTAVLALIRGTVTTSCVADRFGVTEAQVHQWQDTFLIAGSLALDDLLGGYRARSIASGDFCDAGDPTTTPMPTSEDPSTTTDDPTCTSTVFPSTLMPAEQLSRRKQKKLKKKSRQGKRFNA